MIIWEVAYELGVEYLRLWKAYVFLPIDVVKTLYGLIIDQTIIIAIFASAKRIVLGYAISVVLGLIVGLIHCEV